jgi:predicted kinase
MTTKAPPTPVGSTHARGANEDPSNVRPAPRPGQEARGAPDGPPRVHLVIGPVGAGKSTHAIALAADTGALRLTLDDWMTRLFRPDRPPSGVVPWYVERAARCVDQIWVVARAALALGIDVVLEIGLLARSQREAFYARVADTAPHARLVVHVIDADRDVRRARVARRNVERGATFAMEVPAEVFELASDLWEAPGDEEAAGLDLRRVWTDGRRRLRTARARRRGPRGGRS